MNSESFSTIEEHELSVVPCGMCGSGFCDEPRIYRGVVGPHEGRPFNRQADGGLWVAPNNRQMVEWPKWLDPEILFTGKPEDEGVLLAGRLLSAWGMSLPVSFRHWVRTSFLARISAEVFDAAETCAEVAFESVRMVPEWGGILYAIRRAADVACYSHAIAVAMTEAATGNHREESERLHHHLVHIQAVERGMEEFVTANWPVFIASVAEREMPESIRVLVDPNPPAPFGAPHPWWMRLSREAQERR